MTDLIEIVRRSQPPAAWAEGDNIPWNEPAFSERMLREHLSQDHDLASRGLEKIERHVEWIHSVVLNGQPTKILDLTCGPGLYANRLAKLGHECVGVDFSPASVAYATEVATREGLESTFLEGDVRSVDPGDGFGLVMMLYAQFNVFRRADATGLLAHAYQWLTRGSQFLFEPQTYAHVESAGNAGSSWYSAEAGLFSERPHLVLQESFWDENTHTSTTRFYIIDPETGAVTRHALSNEAYGESELRSLLSSTGFQDVRVESSLTGDDDDADPNTFVVRAWK
jgi:SAM-dependent methyltransferase